MTVPAELETARLCLRAWRPTDLAPFGAMNADPIVMEHMPALLSRAESDAMVERIRAHFDEHGFGLWAVEIAGGAPFIGFVGLSVPGFEAAFTPCVEIGWRLAREHWGHGYATEAARASLAAGFERVGLEEIVSFTVPTNVRSLGVMNRLGMRHDGMGDFDHPRLPAEHMLKHHMLYRLTRAAWRSQST